MAQTIGTAAATVLTSAADSREQSTQNSPSSKPHFLRCFRIWETALARKASDDLAGGLLSNLYWRMIGESLTEDEMSALTEMVLDRCQWFPTIAECKAIMGEQIYSNPFYVKRRQQHLTREGYPAIAAPSLQIERKHDEPSAE